MRDREVTRRRLQLTGAVAELDGDAADRDLFAPHFSGLDAGGTALTQQVPRRFTTIYTHAAQPDGRCLDLAGPPALRQRAAVRAASDGVKTDRRRLRAGEPLYLLPDMNFGPRGVDLRAVLRRAGGHRAVAVALCPAGARQGGAGGHALTAAGYEIGCCRPGRIFRPTTRWPTRR